MNDIIEESKLRLVLLHVVWAFYERSHVVGMGIFQAVPDPIAKERFGAVIEKLRMGSCLEIDFDYAFGKMMKTTFAIYKDGRIDVKHSSNPEYCSWLTGKMSPADRCRYIISEALSDAVGNEGIGEETLLTIINRNAR